MHVRLLLYLIPACPVVQYWTSEIKYNNKRTLTVPSSMGFTESLYFSVSPDLTLSSARGLCKSAFLFILFLLFMTFFTDGWGKVGEGLFEVLSFFFFKLKNETRADLTLSD